MAVKKKECESHRNDVKSDFEKKKEWFIENLTEEFRRDTPEKTLRNIDTTNQTSRNVNFVRQNRSECYGNDRTTTISANNNQFQIRQRKLFPKRPRKQ